MMGDDSNTLPKQLHELREVVGQLEPDYLKDSSFKKIVNRVMRRNPVEQYVRRYKTVESQVDI